MSPDPVEIYEVKRSQRYILAAIENKWSEAPLKNMQSTSYICSKISL